MNKRPSPARATVNKVLKRVLYIAVAAGVGSLLVYFVIVKPILVNQDRKKFEQASQSLETLYADIVQKVGKPDQVKREKSCGYAHRVYGRGPLSCSVSVYLLYENKDSAASTSLMHNIMPITGSKLYPGTATHTPDTFLPKDEVRGWQDFSQEYYTKDKLCIITYTYPPIGNSLSVFRPVGGENLQIDLTCGGDAKAEHYPVQN